MSESIFRHSEEIVSFIPCRSGSKGLKNKNFLSIAGKTLTERAIEFSLSMGFVTVVAPDDEFRADELRKYDVHVFLRDKDMADGAHQLDSWAMAHEFMESHYRMLFPAGIMLEPSSPCREPEDVDQTVKMLDHSNAAGTVSVNRKLHPEKIRHFDSHRVGPDLPAGGAGYCQLNGVCYAAKRDVILSGTLFDGLAGVVIDRPIVNIDDINDFRLAEAWILRNERIEITGAHLPPEVWPLPS